MLRFASCVGIAVLACACTDLPAATSGVCGNGAIDPGEDCDGNAAAGQACGAVGDANACRFVCTIGASCPTGFACGLDQRCRAPSGAFALGPGPYPFLAAAFKGGDVDGDGIADLIGIEGARVEVRFGSTSVALSDVTDQILPTSGATPAIADLDGDGRQDLLVPTTLGMVTLLGSAGGFDLHPYSSIPLDNTLPGDLRVEQVHPLPGLQADLLFAYDVVSVNGATLHEQLAYPNSHYATCFDGTVVTDDSCSQTVTLANLSGGDLAIGRTGYVWSCATPLPGVGCDGSAADDPSDEVAIAIQGASKVALLSATEQVVLGVADPTTAALAHVQDIQLPAGRTVATGGRMLFADFDGDHCTDLAIPITNGTAITIAIAYNVGCTGKLADAVAVKTSPINEYAPITGHAIGTPRLAVDLDGDGLADLVTDQQIFHATCSRLQAACGATWKGQGVALVPRAWTSAIGVDLDRDGHVDVVGFVDGEADVDVLLDSGAGTYARFTVLTELPVRAIASGDFDGDLIEDLAIVTGDTTASDENDQLAISYGALSGGPEAPIAMGSFGVIRSLASALIETTPNDPEGISDLLVVDDRATHRDAAVLIGSTSRQVIAPFEIDAPGLESPVVLAVGNFDATAGSDVAQLSSDGTLFVLSGTGGGDVTLGASFTPTGANALAALLKAKVATGFGHAALTAGDQLESLIGFGTPASVAGPNGPVCADTEAVIATPPAGAGGAWVAASLGALAGTAGPSGTCLRVRSVATHDLDGDGATDAVIQLCDGPSCNVAGATVVAFGGSGTLDVASAVAIPTGDLTCGRFATIDVATSGPVSLIAPCIATTGATGTATVTAAYLVTFALAPGTRTYQEVSRFPIAQTDSDLRLTVADFNGDHLPDIALTSGQSTQTVVTFYLQCAAADPACAAIPEVQP